MEEADEEPIEASAEEAPVENEEDITNMLYPHPLYYIILYSNSQVFIHDTLKTIYRKVFPN